MGMDRNTVIGFLLIGAMLIVMFVFNSPSNQSPPATISKADSLRIADSMANLNKKTNQPILKDTMIASPINSGGFADTTLVEQNVVLENEVAKFEFSNKGAQPVSIKLKKFKDYQDSSFNFFSSSYNAFNYKINTGSNATLGIRDLLFCVKPIVENPDKSKTLVFEVTDSANRRIEHTYTLRPNEYMLDFSIDFAGAERLFTQQTLNINWYADIAYAEKDHAYENTQSQFFYKEDGEYDFAMLSSQDDIELDKTTQWFGAKQHFFVQTFINKNGFENVQAKWASVPNDTGNRFLTRLEANTRTRLQGDKSKVQFQLYYGPSDYNILKKYDGGFEQIVPYGSGIFSFVKYINRYFLLPVFNFLRDHIGSMGLVVLLLTLFIRLITSPILYKSYLSGAKMKALKPEVDALREKYKDDQQAFGMEQMKLWKSAGVNPLGGCIPALLQIPIFMSLYFFFQANIDLRGASFLWASDLSQYDSIATLPFSIPFYGDHVSLFTLTAVITSLLISLYGMSNMQDNSNPVMKYLPFIFPILLLGIFNGLPAALTWYYTVSNTITLLLQIIIQKYIIDHNKILAQIEENRKKPVKKSKLQDRIDAMQESQRKLKELKDKSAGKS
jgi:YidC/Oxa1 family membrane protein insertase